MSKVHAVLLVPHEGDPYGLLAEGACGARPPKAWLNDDRYHRLKTDHGRWFSMSEAHVPALESGGDALVLAWDGKPVAEGTYWLHCRMGFMDELEESLISVADLLSGRSADVYWLRRIGTLVLLDAEGLEVKP